jgi:hypothetical protein
VAYRNNRYPIPWAAAVLASQLPFTGRAEPTHVEGRPSGLTMTLGDGDARHQPDTMLTADDSAALFRRAGRIRQVTVDLHPDQLFAH